VGHQLGRGAPPWRDPYSFQPVVSPQINFAGWPFGFFYWPLTALLGAVGAWNAFTILCYLAAGGFTCAWLRELGVPRGAALAGGLAFALAPYRVEQSTGHLLGPVSALLPLALWALERSRDSRAWLALSIAALASIPLAGQVHLSLAATPFFVAYAAVRGRARAGVGAALAAVAAGILVWRLSISHSVEAGGRSLDEVRRYSADWRDLVSRDERHGDERFVFLGWALPLLALAGALVLARSGRVALAVVLALTAAATVALALGTNMPVYAPLWHAFPPLRYPRVPERLLPVGLLCIAALAAFAVGTTRSAVVVPAAAMVLLFADLRGEHYSALPADGANAAYAALGTAPGGNVLDLPVFLPDSVYGSVYQYYTQQAPRGRPVSYSTVAPQRASIAAYRLRSLTCGDWRRHPGDLRRLAIRYVAVHSRLYGLGPAPRRCLPSAVMGLHRLGFRLVARDGPVTLYAR
jgi:hypothetical protein